MTIAQMEDYVRDRFSVGLHEFIRQKVEVESLYDYEVANSLNMHGVQIGKLRRAFRISKGNGFARRFEGRYGKGAVNTFKEIIHKRENTLADAARHFGFSREYARQVYRKVYGRQYTEVFRKKVVARQRTRLDAKMKSKRLKPLMEVMEKMRSLGFSPCIRNDGPSFTIIANGYKLGFRSTSKPVSLASKKRYYRISQGTGSNGHHDFLVCLCGNNANTTHYVIPRHVMPKYGVYLIPEAGPDESKYAKFKEAWHLLTHENQTKEVS